MTDNIPSKTITFRRCPFCNSQPDMHSYSMRGSSFAWVKCNPCNLKKELNASGENLESLVLSAVATWWNGPTHPETGALPESLRGPAVVMERVRALHQQTDTALWLLRYLNRLGGLGHDNHRLIDAVLEGRAYIHGDSLYTDGPPPTPNGSEQS